MLATSFTARAGIAVPIVQAPIAASPALAAAVSEAGGLGQVSCSYAPPAEIERIVADTAARTARPFAVNLVLEWDQRDRLEAALAGGARIVTTFWGDPEPLLPRLREAGVLWLHAVGSLDEARAALGLGADILVAQGWEAGGHVRSQVATLALVPRVVDLAGEVPVVAAGGIGDGRGLAAALCLGAGGAWLGTRFLVAAESPTHERFADLVLEADADGTARPAPFTIGWDGEHRVLRTPLVEAWEAAGSPGPGERPGEGETVAATAEGKPLPRYHYASPRDGVTGSIDEMALYAGQSAGLVTRRQPAGDIVREIAAEAEAVLARLGGGAA